MSPQRGGEDGVINVGIYLVKRHKIRKMGRRRLWMTPNSKCSLSLGLSFILGSWADVWSDYLSDGKTLSDEFKRCKEKEDCSTLFQHIMLFSYGMYYIQLTLPTAETLVGKNERAFLVSGFWRKSYKKISWKYEKIRGSRLEVTCPIWVKMGWIGCAI